MSENKISPNVLTFIGLANEYCVALSNTYEAEKDEFVAEMLRLLPRIYISMCDVNVEQPMFETTSTRALQVMSTRITTKVCVEAWKLSWEKTTRFSKLSRRI